MQTPSFDASKSLPAIYRVLPTAVDILTVGGYFLFVPWLGSLIAEQSAWNHVILLPGFILLIIGVVLVRMLPAYSINEKKDPGILAVCLVFFMVVIYSMLYAGATNIGGSGKGNDTVAAVIFFIFLVPFLMSFFWPVERTTKGTKKAFIVESISLAIVNYFTLVGAAVWYCFSSMEVSEGATYATGIWHLILFSILFLVFLAFFGLPRIYLLLATGNLRGFLAYLITTAVFLWSRVPPLN